jgi:hypothetical protein
MALREECFIFSAIARISSPLARQCSGSSTRRRGTCGGFSSGIGAVPKRSRRISTFQGEKRLNVRDCRPLERAAGLIIGGVRGTTFGAHDANRPEKKQAIRLAVHNQPDWAGTQKHSSGAREVAAAITRACQAITTQGQWPAPKSRQRRIRKILGTKVGSPILNG